MTLTGLSAAGLTSFPITLGSSVEIDTQVYTPEEFETLKDTLARAAPGLR